MLSFNSTLVQLKVKSFPKKHLENTCFNSTLVQLKAGVTGLRRLFNFLFQFYLSSIKSVTASPYKFS